VDFRLRRYHEGRHLTRLGSRRRVDLDPDHAAGQPGAQERLEQLERTRVAADRLADLDPLERRVIVLMASQSIGPLAVSRQLELPLGEVRSAARSARLKLERVAVIAQAGRMCHHRRAAITAAAQNTASAEQARQARAHLAACATCRRRYRRLQRQTEPGHSRQVITAVLPAPVVGLLHRLAGWVARRPTLPPGAGERAAQFAAGGGLAKAAAATTAVIAATASITSGLHIHHRLRRHPTVPVHAATAASGPTPTRQATSPAASTPLPPAGSTAASPPPAEHPSAEVPSAAEREFTPAQQAPTVQNETPVASAAPPRGSEPTAQSATTAPGAAEAAAREFGEPGQ
jgi:hypothetical protein